MKIKELIIKHTEIKELSTLSTPMNAGIRYDILKWYHEVKKIYGIHDELSTSIRKELKIENDGTVKKENLPKEGPQVIIQKLNEALDPFLEKDAELPELNIPMDEILKCDYSPNTMSAFIDLGITSFNEEKKSESSEEPKE